MLVGIQGRMGTGKTISMSILAEYLRRVAHAPTHANYFLKNASRLNSLDDVWKLDGGVLCFDEIWLTLDARRSGGNIHLTRFINQTRKKKLIVLYTTQHIRQVDVRVRDATDILISCEKRDGVHWLTLIDWQYQTILRSYAIDDLRPFYGLYDTYEVLQPLVWDDLGQTKRVKLSTGYPHE